MASTNKGLPDSKKDNSVGNNTNIDRKKALKALAIAKEQEKKKLASGNYKYEKVTHKGGIKARELTKKREHGKD